MLSFAPNPIFSGPWDNRPAVPSPLSSSPLRASSPLSPVDANKLPQRQAQSSPLQPPPSKFKFASRPTRPNPVMKRREDAQESRRREFLQKVRQKADDKAWQRRDIEGQFLRTSLLDNMAHLSRDAPSFTDADIEDALAFQQEMTQPERQQFDSQAFRDDDSVMEDEFPEDDDLDAMVASYEEQQTAPSQRPPSPTMSDDDYDDIFAELIAQEQQQQQSQPQASAESMDVAME